MRDRGCIALELTKNLLQPKFIFYFILFFLSSVTVTSYIIDVCYNLKKNGTKHMARLG